MVGNHDVPEYVCPSQPASEEVQLVVKLFASYLNTRECFGMWSIRMNERDTAKSLRGSFLSSANA